MSKIIIDPGHGGNDAGAISSGVKEKDITLAISKLLVKELEGQKIPVSTTRPSDISVSLAKRVAFANDLNAIAFVSLHCNWSESPDPNGTQTYIYKFGGNAEKLASKVQARLQPANGVSKWERVEDENFYVLRETNMPAILIELGFISSEVDRQMLTDPVKQKWFAKEICKGICGYLGTTYKEATDMSKTGYKDEAQMSDWAINDIAKAKELGIMKGDKDGNFRPKANLTREEAAVLAMNIYRALK